MGEALAALLAIFLVSSFHSDRFIVEGDYEVVFLTLQHPDFSQDWRIFPIIYDILVFIPFASIWEARKVKRNTNFFAYFVARLMWML